ncbi:MAG: hypothetical protein JSV89_08105 [Spirochaetaceae bacterium]|nr:MAG: hypothetical protein JSV89_08105 [Spirochaetaceae bacterium]
MPNFAQVSRFLGEIRQAWMIEWRWACRGIEENSSHQGPVGEVQVAVPERGQKGSLSELDPSAPPGEFIRKLISDVNDSAVFFDQILEHLVSPVTGNDAAMVDLHNLKNICPPNWWVKRADRARPCQDSRLFEASGLLAHSGKPGMYKF